MATLMSSESESGWGRRTRELEIVIESIDQPNGSEENLSLRNRPLLSGIKEVHKKGITLEAEFYLFFFGQKVIYVPVAH